MQIHGFVLFSLIATTPWLGCKKDAAPQKNTEADKEIPVAAATASVETPADVLVVANLPDGLGLKEVKDAVAAVDPDKAAMLPLATGQFRGALIREMVGVEVDLSASAQVLVMNPKKFDSPIVYLGSAKATPPTPDTAETTKLEVRSIGNRSAVGSKEALDAVGAYMAALKPGKRLRITAYPAHLVAAYKTEIESLPAMAAAAGAPEGPDLEQLMKFYSGMALAIPAGVERIEMMVDSGEGRGTAMVTVVAKKDSSFAKLCAAQSPNSFVQLLRTPVGKPIVLDSNIVAGPAKKAILDATDDMLSIFSFVSKEKRDAYTKSLHTFADIMTGEMAASIGMIGFEELQPQMAGVTFVGTNGKADARTVMDEMFQAFASDEAIEVFGTRQQMQYTPNAGSHDGVPWAKQVQTVSTGAGNEPYTTTSYITAVENRDIALVFGKETDVESVIDALKSDKRRSYTPMETKVISDAKARRASAIMLIDMQRIVPSGGPNVAIGMAAAFEKSKAVFFLDFYRPRP